MIKEHFFKKHLIDIYVHEIFFKILVFRKFYMKFYFISVDCEIFTL